MDKFPEREKAIKEQIPKPYGPAWRGPNSLEDTAQKSWDKWSHMAEGWLMDLAQIPDNRLERKPYRGRGSRE
eukprot:8615613-Heterocapsa_arctica.AAC.1